jgi:hypothetical protein
LNHLFSHLVVIRFVMPENQTARIIALRPGKRSEVGLP